MAGSSGLSESVINVAMNTLCGLLRLLAIVQPARARLEARKK